MKSLEVTWVRAIAPVPGHYLNRHAMIDGKVLCGKLADGEAREFIAFGPRCPACKETIGKLQTPEGQLLFEVFGTVFVSDETKKLAEHVVEENSKLAIRLRESIAKIEALYKGPDALVRSQAD